MTRARGCLAACCASLAACSEPEPPPIVWEGEHLRFGTHEDVSRICAGTLPRADAYVGALKGLFDVDPPYVAFSYYLPNEDDISAFCDDGITCTREHSGTFSRSIIVEHELVHNVRSTLGWPYRPLEEGIAEVFGDDAWTRVAVQGDVANAFEKHESGAYITGREYPLMGHFVSYLLETDGLETFQAFTRDSDLDDDYEAFAASFQRAYHRPLPEAIADYTADYPVCNHSYYRDNTIDCDQPAIPVQEREWDDTLVVGPVSLDCDQADVLGPRAGERWTTRVLEVTLSGLYFVTATKTGGARPGRFRVRPCTGSCNIAADDIADAVLDGDAPIGSSDGDTMCLPEGRYLLRLSVDDDDAGAITVSLRSTFSAHVCEKMAAQ
jgi:hypothetical protein